MVPALHRAAADAPHRLLAAVLPVLLTAFLAAGVCAPDARAAATVPPGTIGMNDWTVPSEATLASVSRAGVKRWRAGLFWDIVEHQRGVRNWAEYDRLVGASARQGVSLLLIMASCPPWACSDISGPPTRSDAVAAQLSFMREAVERYGTNGSFWRARPELPRLPVTEWQVANEVNAREFWKPGPEPAHYAAFLRDNAAAIRGADPRARVVLSGLTDYGQMSIADFLTRLYAQPGFKGSFDAVAVHAYAPDTAAVARLLDRSRNVMVRHGDVGKQVWVTEMGWGTSTPSLHTPTTPARQAQLMRESFDMMIGCRGRWNLGLVYWFAYRDARPPAGQADNAGYHTGLFDLAGRPKPAWTTLHAFRAGAPLRAGCSIGRDSRAPQTRIRSRKRFAGTSRARMRLAASERGSRFQCRLARRGSRSSAARRWRRCRSRYRTPRLRRGRYRLMVRAVDRSGNADRTPASVRLRVGRRYGRVVIRVRR